MSHVTDGELQAYLDGALHEMDRERADDVGAHLRLCGDCRARLEESREIRERAGEILASVAPAAVEVPPFEEIEAAAAERRGGTGVEGEPSTSADAGRRSPRRDSWTVGRVAGLAWAASVAFALAVGWQGRRLWEPPTDAGRFALNERLQPSAPEPTSVEKGASDPETEPSITYADEVEQSSGARGSNLGSVEPVGEEADAAQAVSRPEVLGAAADRRAGGRRDAEGAAEDRKAADSRTNDLPAPERQARTAEEPPPDARAAEEPPASWLRVSVDDAAHWLGAPLLSVPDAAVEEVEITSRDGARVVRVRQRLASGVVVELVETRALAGAPLQEGPPPDAVRTEEARTRPAGEGADSGDARPRVIAAPPAAHDAAALWTVSARLDGVRVTLRAPLAVDSLRSLLSRLR